MTTPAPVPYRRTFISHAHADNDVCARFAAALRARGIDCWLDLDNAQKGYALSEDIERQLERRAAFVLFVTAASSASHWVGLELNNYTALWADQATHVLGGQERMILPVRLEPVPVPTRVRGFNWIDAVGQPFDRVVEQIVRALTISGDPPPIETVPVDTVPAPVTAGPRREQARALLDGARDAAKAGQWRDALAKAGYLAAQPIAQAEPEFAAPLALLYDGAGRWAESRPWTERAIAADDSRPDLRLALARAALMAGDLTAAQAALHLARVFASPRDTPTRLDLLREERALALAEQRWNEARAALAEALALVGNDFTQVFPIAPERFSERLADLGATPRRLAGVEVILPPLCSVPAGPFRMGSDPKQDSGTYDSEKPQHEVNVAAFQIARFPVTVAEYACFVRAGHAAPQRGIFRPITWDEQLKHLDHPAVCVSWQDATAYAAWLAQTTGQAWRLPTEAEWEKAARYDPATRASRLYPWGDAFDKSRCNTSESGKGGTTPVGTYPSGASPCGAQDMAGNVLEWTSSIYKPYPYNASDGRERADSTENRVLRGGSWNSGSRYARAAGRGGDPPGGIYGDGGFRVALVCAVPSS